MKSRAQRAPGQSGGRCAVEKAVGRKASATESRLDLGGHTLRMPVPVLLVLLFCLRGRAGIAKGGVGGKCGEGLFASCRFTGVNGAEGLDSWI